MENSEYFQGIAAEVKKNRTKGEYTEEEMRSFEEGKCEALRSILVSLHPENADIWDKHRYTSRELHDFIMLEIKNLITKIKKARRIYLQNQKMIMDLTQLQID